MIPLRGCENYNNFIFLFAHILFFPPRFFPIPKYFDFIVNQTNESFKGSMLPVALHMEMLKDIDRLPWQSSG